MRVRMRKSHLWFLPMKHPRLIAPQQLQEQPWFSGSRFAEVIVIYHSNLILFLALSLHIAATQSAVLL